MYGNSMRELWERHFTSGRLNSFRCGGPKARALHARLTSQILRTVDEGQACFGGEEPNGNPLSTNGEATGVLDAAVGSAENGAESSPKVAEKFEIED